MNAALAARSDDLDHFGVLGQDRRFLLDPEALEREFLARSRRHHPDRFAGADPEELSVAQRSSARINDAYRTLKDPVLRAEHLLSLEGIGREEGDARCPPDLLMEVFELRERLADDPSETLRGDVRGLLDAVDDRLSGLYERHDAEAPGARRDLLKEVREALDRRKFLMSLYREVEQALGSR